MSAGDVFFKGWVGSNPKYKELTPEFSFESVSDGEITWPTGQPLEISENYVKKKITRRLICFAQEKAAVIATTDINNKELSTIYIDTLGAVQTLSLGKGWKLLAVSDAPYKTGFSIITISYEKIVPRAFELGLPEGLSFTSNGVSFNNKAIEVYDGGPAVLQSGQYIVISKPFSQFGMTDRVNDLYQNPVDAEAINATSYAKAELYQNETVIDVVSINGSEVTYRHSPKCVIDTVLESPTPGTGVETTKAAAQTERESWINLSKLSEADIQDIIDDYKAKNPDRTYTTISFEVIQTVTGGVAPFVLVTKDELTGKNIYQQAGYQWTGAITRILRRTEIYNLPIPSYRPYMFCDKSGNDIVIYFGDKVWRNINVAGL